MGKVISNDNDCVFYELDDGVIISDSLKMEGVLCSLADYGRPKETLENNNAGVWCNKCLPETYER